MALTVEECRDLLASELRESLSDEKIIELRDLLWTMAGIIVEIHSELGTIDQSRFYPTGNTFSQSFRLLGNEGE